MQGLPRAGDVIRAQIVQPVLCAHAGRDVMSRRWRRPSVALDMVSRLARLDSLSRITRLNARRWHDVLRTDSHTLKRSQHA